MSYNHQSNVASSSSAAKQSLTSNIKPNRLPAPTLFVGPPSRNASQLSVGRAGADSGLRPNGRPAVDRQRTTRSRIYKPDENENNKDDTSNLKDVQELPTLKKPSENAVDAKWRELQLTLNEVELTAQSSTHVFGESHAKALDELRMAQVALANAWGRSSDESEVKDSINSDAPGANVGSFKAAEDLASERQNRARANTAGSASTVLSDESALSQTSTRSGKTQLEDETAQDIKLASERRAANEAYFKKVDQSVKEVVEKLERVAEAMRGVEAESRSLWSNSDMSSSLAESSPQSALAPDG